MRAGSKTPSNSRNAGPASTSSISARSLRELVSTPPRSDRRLVSTSVSRLDAPPRAYNPTAVGSGSPCAAGRGRNGRSQQADPSPPFYGSRIRYTPLARLAFHREHAPDAGRDRAHHSALAPATVLRVEDAARDDRKSSRGEGEREKERILENLPRQMPYVPEHAHGAEHHEHPPLQQHGERYEARVYETVDAPI